MLSLISSVGSADNPAEIALDQSTTQLLVETEIASFLDSYDTRMKLLVAGEIDLPYWTPSAAYIPIEAREFISNLKIPEIRVENHSLPNMLLHRMGRFQDDPALNERLETLFHKGVHK